MSRRSKRPPSSPRPRPSSPRPTPSTAAPARPRRRPRRGLLLAGAGCLLALVALVIVLATSGGGGEAAPQLTGSGYPNGDFSNARDAGGSIDAESVSRLGVAWTLPLSAKSAYGSYSASPVISNGVIYSQDLASNVQAIDLHSGKVLWSKSFESPDQGPNGLVVAQGRVYGATATSAFALDQKTGAQLWSVTLARNPHEGVDMAPGYHDGIVYVATVPGNNEKFYGAGGVGVLWALQASTGRRLWHFDTVPEGLWGHPQVNSGGGLWYTPAFDSHGSMYIGVANPAPFPGTASAPWGSSRPGPDLYTDSIVKLDASTGKLEWYYQLTPHDLYDWDLQDPPILLDPGGREMVIAAGKSGIVIALDAASGKPLWKRPVGVHDGHDHDSLYAMRGEYSKLHLPETVYPGLLGGVIAPMASDGSTIFVPVVNLPVKFTSQTEQQEGPGAGGEVLALDAATGAVRWHQTLSAPAFGAVTVANDLVFATIASGTLYAFEAASGHLLWETQLPAGTNTGVAVHGDTLIAPAGLPQGSSQSAELVAYRLGGSSK